MNLFFWDFHGVLEIGNIHSVHKVTNEVLKKSGFNIEVDLEFIKKNYGKKWIDYYKSLKLDIQEDLLETMVKTSSELGEFYAIKYMKAQKNAYNVLNEIHSKHHHNFIYSNTAHKILREFINILNYKNIVKEYIGYDSINNITLNKKEMIKTLSNNYNYDKLIVVGDTAEDMLAGKYHRANTYLFLCPLIYSKYEFNKISNNNADFKINDLKQVLKEL